MLRHIFFFIFSTMLRLLYMMEYGERLVLEIIQKENYKDQSLPGKN